VRSGCVVGVHPVQLASELCRETDTDTTPATVPAISVLWVVAKLEGRPPPPTQGSQISDLEVSHTGGIADRLGIRVRSVSKLSTSVADVFRDVSGMRDL